MTTPSPPAAAPCGCPQPCTRLRHAGDRPGAALSPQDGSLGVWRRQRDDDTARHSGPSAVVRSVCDAASGLSRAEHKGYLSRAVLVPALAAALPTPPQTLLLHPSGTQRHPERPHARAPLPPRPWAAAAAAAGRLGRGTRSGARGRPEGSCSCRTGRPEGWQRTPRLHVFSRKLSGRWDAVKFLWLARRYCNNLPSPAALRARRPVPRGQRSGARRSAAL